MRSLNASVLERKALNRNLSWGFPLGNLLPKTRVLKHRVLERKRRPNANASVLGTQRFRTLRISRWISVGPLFSGWWACKQQWLLETRVSRADDHMSILFEDNWEEPPATKSRHGNKQLLQVFIPWESGHGSSLGGSPNMCPHPLRFHSADERQCWLCTSAHRWCYIPQMARSNEKWHDYNK